MLKSTPQSLLRFNPLDEPPDFDPLDLPPQWTAGHCGLRLCEGFKVLRQLPVKGSPAGFKNGWPVAYLYEWEDLLAQQEQGQLAATMREQNRVRLRPSYREVTRCETVIAWSGQYLHAFDHLCAAVNAVALAHSLGLDAGWVTRKRGGHADTWRQRHDRGCALIAAGLIRDRISVF
jgi:hypothetical protein